MTEGRWLLVPQRGLVAASVMGPGVKLPRFILPLVTCFCPWSA